MDYRPFLPRQASGCVVCPSPLPCACQANEECIRISRDCSKCDENKCVPVAGQTASTNAGVSKGALAGGIVGTILFFAVALGLFFAYRRKTSARKARVRHSVKDTPAPAEMVLNRPDPTEKPPSELTNFKQEPITPTNNPQLHSGLNSPMNPFDDVNSIQTAVTEGTNVIPIALMSPESEAPPSSPVRPVRTPDVSLNLEHLNVSHDNVRTGAGSTLSGFSGISRNSYMSSASYASEFLNEAPKIMTPTQGAVRQVLGVVKAEVINTATSDTLKPSSHCKPPVRSPLASTSFGPNQTLQGDGAQTIDPFADENMSTQATDGLSPAPTISSSRDHRESAQSTLVPDMPEIPAIAWDNRSRPASLSTQAGSVIDIASATRVNLGLKSPGSGGSFRTTVGRLVGPTVGAGALQEQQRRALATQALHIRRVSGSSVLSATSTRADSILESFPFVPPSPISDRPIRSPPVSPLAKQSFTASGSSSLTNTLVPPSPMTHQAFSLDTGNATASMSPVGDPLPAPPNRRMLGMSTGSNISTASSGLGSFPFQIESETSAIETPLAAYTGLKRASLDTLALTNDLSSYPLSFDRNSFPTPEK